MRIHCLWNIYDYIASVAGESLCTMSYLSERGDCDGIVEGKMMIMKDDNHER